MDVTEEELAGAGELADQLLVVLACGGAAPQQAALALAIVLGATCQRFAIDPVLPVWLVTESYRASRELAREEEASHGD